MQSFSVGWGRTWRERLVVRVRVNKCRSTQAVSAGAEQGCRQTMAGFVQLPSPALLPQPSS